MSPLVSVVIPCYKGARFLADALESCLRQTYRHIEVIVVDDASPDNCAVIADGFAQRDKRVSVIRRPKNGRVSRAFNTGFDAAKGDYFTRLAQDDLFGANAIEMMVQHLESNPQCGLIYANQQLIDEDGNPTKLDVVKEPEEALQHGNEMGLCVMWRREVWQAVGKFDPVFDTAEDYEYWLRVSRKFKIDKIPGEALLYFRQHNQMGSTLFSSKQYATVQLARTKHLVSNDEKNQTFAQIFHDECWRLRKEQDYKSALLCACQCIRFCPIRLMYWKSAIGTAVRLMRFRTLHV